MKKNDADRQAPAGHDSRFPNERSTEPPDGSVERPREEAERLSEEKEGLLRLIEKLEAVHEITGIATSSLSVDEISKKVLKRLGERLCLTVAIILVLDERREELVPMALYGYPPGFIESIGPLSIDSDHEAPRVFKSGKTKIIEDIDAVSISQTAKDAARKIEALTGKPTRSYIINPLTVYQKVIGIISFAWPEARAFGPEDVEFFTSIAREVAVGLENARLYEDERKIRRLSEALNRVNSAVAATMSVDEILQKVAVEGAEALGCDAAGIILKEDDQWVLRYLYGLPSALVGTHFSGEQMAHVIQAAETGQPVMIPDVVKARLDRRLIDKFNLEARPKTDSEIGGFHVSGQAV